MFATYLRLRLRASASDIDVIRATYARFDKRVVKANRLGTRAARKALYRDMLRYHASAARIEGFRSY